MKKLKQRWMKLVGVLMLLSLLSMGCGISNSPKPNYHLGPFPSVPKYSKQFYQVVPESDKKLIVEREYLLEAWKGDALRLESLYNK
jgi:hypothetical protein